MPPSKKESDGIKLEDVGDDSEKKPSKRAAAPKPQEPTDGPSRGIRLADIGDDSEKSDGSDRGTRP